MEVHGANLLPWAGLSADLSYLLTSRTQASIDIHCILDVYRAAPKDFAETISWKTVRSSSRSTLRAHRSTPAVRLSGSLWTLSRWTATPGQVHAIVAPQARVPVDHAEPRLAQAPHTQPLQQALPSRRRFAREQRRIEDSLLPLGLEPVRLPYERMWCFANPGKTRSGGNRGIGESRRSRWRPPCRPRMWRGPRCSQPGA